MKIAIILLICVIAIAVVLKLSLHILQRNLGYKTDMKDQMIDLKPDMNLNIINAEKIDLMMGNANSPVRNRGEGFYDGILKELSCVRSEKAPEKNILRIMSDKMEKN